MTPKINLIRKNAAGMTGSMTVSGTFAAPATSLDPSPVDLYCRVCRNLPAIPNTHSCVEWRQREAELLQEQLDYDPWIDEPLTAEEEAAFSSSMDESKLTPWE